MKKQSMVQRMMSEKILFGGEIMTRKQVYDLLMKEGRRKADYFAFKPDPVEETD